MTAPYCPVVSGRNKDGTYFHRCGACGWQLIDDNVHILRRCENHPNYIARHLPRRCVHLGEPRKGSDGAAVSVKCECGGGGESYHHVFACEIAAHPRCLPTLVINGEQLAEWQARKPESDLYQLCHGCPDFTPAADAEANARPRFAWPLT